MKKFLVLLLLGLSICSYGAIYSSKTNIIPQTYDEMVCQPFILGNSNKTFVKIMHTNREVFIGVRCQDNISLLDKKIYSEENPLYDGNRVEISLCEKNKEGDFLEYIIYPGGIIYDAHSKNSMFNNKYKVYPKIGKDYWEFILIVDKNTLSPHSKSYDDWEIKINKINERVEYIEKSPYNWVDLYWTSDEECFKAYENKKDAKLREINKNIEYLSPSLQKTEKNYIDEINELSKTPTRDSVNKIRDIFSKIEALNTYCIGANQQKDLLKLGEALPFMFSFVDCGNIYNTKNIIKYRNNTELDLKLLSGEEATFGLMISPYENIDNLKISYEGDFQVKIGKAWEINNIIDPYSFSGNDLVIDNIIPCMTKLIMFGVKPDKTGEHSGNIIISTNNKSIKLPVSYSVSNIKLNCKDNVIVSFKDFFTFSDNISDTLDSIKKICSYLAENNIYSVSLDFANVNCWFDFKQNEFGKYEVNSRNFDLAVKTIFSSGIKNIYIEPLKNMEDQYRVRAFAYELSDYLNLSNIYLIVSEKNKKSKIYNDYIEILNNKVKIFHDEDLVKNNYLKLDNNVAIRQDLCKIYLDNNDEKLLVDCSLDHESPFSFLYYEYGSAVTPSLRFKELKEAIVDESYLSLLQDKINENKKSNKPYNDGEVILKQFMDLQLVKAPELLSDSEFNSMRNKTIQFINK